jgi:hypothetical protein
MVDMGNDGEITNIFHEGAFTKSGARNSAKKRP